MKLPKILTQYCPKNYENVQNFAQNLDILHQPGVACAHPAPPPPTSMTSNLIKLVEHYEIRKRYISDLTLNNLRHA